eukprot:jgi/Galph1/30/GphlegSOOS_G4847.1
MLSLRRHIREFQVTLLLEELRQFPLSHGIIFAKWKVPPALAEPHFGFTKKVQVVRNSVTWNDTFSFVLRLGATGERGEELRSTILRISVREEKTTGLGHVRHGIVEFDIAKFAGLPTVQKSFLLQESRTNAVLNISITLRQLSGDPTFKRPTRGLPYRSLPVTEEEGSHLQEKQSFYWKSRTSDKVEHQLEELETISSSSDNIGKNFFHVLELNSTEDGMTNYSAEDQRKEPVVPAHIRATRIDAEALVERIMRDVIPNFKDSYFRRKKHANGSQSEFLFPVSPEKRDHEELEDSEEYNLDIDLLQRTRDSGSKELSLLIFSQLLTFV